MPTVLPEERQYSDLQDKPIIRDDTNFAAGRIAFFQYVTVGVFLFLISAYWRLQVQNWERYDEAAQRNRIKSAPIPAPRGKILDRDGRVIVDNLSTFSLLLSRENLKEEHLPAIAGGLHMDLNELLARLHRFRSRPRYEPIIIKEGLSPGEIAFVESHRDPDTFPELELIQTHRRVYPKNNFLAHVVGYVGEASEAELDLAEFAKYGQGDLIGKYGIERQYNDVLMGTDGQRRVVVDNVGRERETFNKTDAVPGHSIQLTVDLDVQAAAELALEGKRGAVVALDPRTGEVLAMASRPGYDPNMFAGRISTSAWKEINSSADYPMLNRAIQAQLSPGSTFKPMMAVAGLELGIIDETTTAWCAGSATYYDRPFKCHSTHGRIELHRALAQSCDIYFYNLGKAMGIDRLSEWAEMNGLGKKTGVDLPHEYAGLVPNQKWKIRTQRQRWFPGDTISVAIGQGFLTTTPLQLAYSIGGIASGGVFHRPHLVRDTNRQEPPRKVTVKPETIAKVASGMYAVVNEGGTAGMARLPGIEFCGKTGTAQIASLELAKSSKYRGQLKDNAFFVGFAPRHNPEIAIAVLVESGEHGFAAALLARDVVRAYYEKKNRPKQPNPMQALLRRFAPAMVIPAEGAIR